MWKLFAATVLVVSCGPVSETPADHSPRSGSSTTSSGSTSPSTSGAGGSPSGGPAPSDAATDGFFDAVVPGVDDAATADVAPQDGGGANDSNAARDASARDAATPPDGNPLRDASSPGDASVTPGDASAHDLIREMLGRFDVAEIEAKSRTLESMSRPDRYTKSANYLKLTEWVRDFMATEAPAAVVRFDEQ